MTGRGGAENRRDCPTCDTYQLCKTYDRIPEGETGCADWEPARLPEDGNGEHM